MQLSTNITTKELQVHKVTNFGSLVYLATVKMINDIPAPKLENINNTKHPG